MNKHLHKAPIIKALLQWFDMESALHATFRIHATLGVNCSFHAHLMHEIHTIGLML